MRAKLSVPLEFVEQLIADECRLDGPLVIENVMFDEDSLIAVMMADFDASDATKLPWIDSDPEVFGVPV